MATEDKPESTFATEKEKEDKEFLTETSGLQVDKFLPVEKKQDESFPDKSQGSIESNFIAEYPTHDIEGSYVPRNSEQKTEEESRDLWKYEDELEHKFPTTTAFFKGDPQHTSFPTREECSELSSSPADTKIDPEMLHSSVTVLDETKESKNNSDFAVNVSMKDDSISSRSAFPGEYNEMKERENGHSNKELLCNPLVAELKNDKCMESDNFRKLEENSGTKKEDIQDSTNLNQEIKETSNEFQLPAMDNKESSSNDRQSSCCDNPKPTREVSATGYMKIKESHSEVENQNKSLEEPDSLHANVPLEIAASLEDSPSVISIQEQMPIKSDQEDLNTKHYRTSFACDTKVEDGMQEYTGTHIEEILEAHRTDDQQNIFEKMKEEKMPEQDVKSSTLQTYRDDGMVHDQNNSEEYINQAIEDQNVYPGEVKQDINPYKLTVEEYHGNTENVEQNRTSESVKEDGSLQEFQIIAQDEAADEANNLELLDVKDLSHVTSNEIPKAVILQAAKDVIWEQKEVPITKESEEIKEVNEELAYATNLVSQSSKENSRDHKAIAIADDSTDDNLLGTSDIYLHEKPQETINSTRTGLSSEEIYYPKLENIPGPPLQHQTKTEHADKVSITNLAENEAAGESKTNSTNESQDHSTNMLVDSGEIQTVEYNEADKTAEDSSKEITDTGPESKIIAAVVETKLQQTSPAAEVVDLLEEIPVRKLPNQEESLNIIERKNDSIKNNEYIVNEISDASFATTLREAFSKKEQNKASGSDVRGDTTKEIEEDHNGTEISESEPMEYLSVIDDPSTVECEKSKEAAMEDRTEDGENINSENTNTDGEHLALSQSLGKYNQTVMKDEKYDGASEQLPGTDQIRESELDIPSPQEFSKETEMKKEVHTTEEKDANIQIRNLNQILEASASDNLVEKIGEKSGAEDSRCGPPEQEVIQETYQEDELKPVLDPRETAARIFKDTKHLEEPETMDAIRSFKKQMPSEHKFAEGSSQVSTEVESADCSHVEEGKDKSLHEEINPEVHPGIKMPCEDKIIEAPTQVSIAKGKVDYSAAEEYKEKNVNDTKQEEDPEVKFEESERINTTESFLKQLQNEEKVAERPHQVSIAKQIVHNSPAEEEEEERNVNETKKKHGLKPEVVPGSTAEGMSKAINKPSNATKFEEAQNIEPTQSFNKQIPSDEEIVERPSQVAQEIISDSPAEEEELNHKDKTAPDDLMPEIQHGVKFKEPKMIEERQRFYTEMQSENIDVERPPQFSIAEHAVNYNAAEKGNKERIVTDTATFQDELNPDVDFGKKADEIPETMTNASENTEFRQPEMVDTSFNIQMTLEDKVTEEPHQVTISEGILDHFPVEANEKTVKVAPLDEQKLEEVARFEGPETAVMNQNFKKPMPRVDKVIDGPPQDSVADNVIDYSPREDVKGTIISNKQQPQVDPGVEVNEISQTINNASENTKVDITQHSNEEVIDEDMVIEGPSQVSIEEIPYQMPGEEKTKGNVKDTTIRDELKTEVGNLMVHEIPQTTKIASEITKSKEPETMEATQRLNTEMELQNKDVETTLPVSFAEEAVKYKPAEERKEDIINDTTGDELKPAVDPEVKVNETSEITDHATQITKIEERDMIYAARSFKKQTPSKDQVDEEPRQVLTAEKTINYAPAEEQKEEVYVSNSTKEDELKSEVYTEVQKDEISETLNSGSESTKMMDAKQSCNMQMKSEDKVFIVEDPHQASTSEETGNYSLIVEEGLSVNDTKAINELNQKLDPEVGANEISGTTYYASESTKFQEDESIDATQSLKKQMQGEDMVERPTQISNAEEQVDYNPRKEERNVKETTTPDELKPRIMVNEISEDTNNINESIKLEEPEMTEVPLSFNKKMAREEKIFEGPPQDSSSKKILNYSTSEKGKDENNVEDTTSKYELNIERNSSIKVDEISETTSKASETTKFEEHEPIEIAQSFEKQMPLEDKAVERPSESPIAEGVISYSPEKEVMEGRIVKDAKAKEESKSEEDTGVKSDEISETTINASESTQFDETETMHATQSFKEKCPSEDKDAEGPCPVSIGVEVVDHSPAPEEKHESNAKNRTTRWKQADEFANTNTENEIWTLNAKVESNKVELPKYEEDGHGSSEQEKVFRNASSEITTNECTETFGAYQVSEAEPEKPEDKTTWDSPKREVFAKAQTNNSESHMDNQRSQDSPNESELKITTAIGCLDPEKQEDHVHEAGNLLLLETPEDAGSNKRDIKGQYCTITEKESWEDMSGIPQESSFKYDKKEEKVEVSKNTLPIINLEICSQEHVKPSEQTSVTKVHDDENEDKKFPNEDEYHYSLIMEEDSEREVQSEPHLNKRPTDGMLPESEVREATNQVDNSNKEIAEKDDLVDDLTTANNDSGPIHTPFESSIAVSNLEIVAKDHPKTGTNDKIAQDEEMSIKHKGPTGETLQQEIKELKPEDASKAAAKAESSFKDNRMEERVEEYIKLSRQTIVTKLHEDENEDKNFPNQDDSHSSLAMEQDSARDVQSEPHLNKRPTEGMLSVSEGIKASNQVDNSNMEISQKDDPVHDLIEDNYNSGPMHTPFESSTAVSNLEITAKDPITGTSAKIASQDDEKSIMQKCPTGETLQPEIEESKPEDASKAVAKALSDVSEESSFKDDKMEEKVEEQVQLSKQTSVAKLYEDENEDKLFKDQDEHHSSFKMDGSVKEVQRKPYLNKRPTEGMLKESEGREVTNQVDHTNKGIAQKDDLVDDLTKANNNSGAIQMPFESSITASNLEIMAKEDPKTGTYAKIASQDEEISISQTGPPDEILQPEIEELKPEDASKAVAKAASSIPQESSFKDEEMEEKVEEQVKLSKQTSVTNLYEDESKDKKFQDQDEYHSSFIMDNSAKEVQSEPHLSKRPTQEMLQESEGIEATNQVDKSNKGITQKDDAVDDLTKTNTDSRATRTPIESSTAASNLEIMAKDCNIASQDLGISTLQKGPPGETLQLEIEELKPEDASKAVAKALSDIPEESSFKDDEMKEKVEVSINTLPTIDSEISNTTISAEHLPSKQEQTGKETTQAQEDEAQHQQKNITNSTMTITRKDGPMNDAKRVKAGDPLVEGTPNIETEKKIEKVDPNSSSTETKNLKEVQREGIATSFYTVENQEPANYNEDTGNKEETRESTSEETSMTSLHNLLQTSGNENTKVTGDLKIESNQTIQRDEMKDGIAGTLGCDEPNSDEDKDEEVEGDTQRKAESAYGIPVIVEASRDANVKVTHKKSHNILSGVGSKVKHSIAKVKKVIIGKSSHPKPSSPK